MCSLVMNLKAEYLFGIPHRTKLWNQLGSRGIFGYRSGGSPPQIHAEFQVRKVYILGCFVALID